MKKIILLLLLVLFVVSGCGKENKENLIKKFKDKVASSKAYELKATMEIYSDEDTYKYDVTVSFKKDDFYRVSLINQTNSHEQLIIKNEEGIYVVTPTLNKSFKFQSEWPKNSSQAYLLHSLVDDLNKEGLKELTENESGYEITTKVNYPNNPDLVSGKMYFNKDMDLKKVEVLGADGKVKIKVEITSIDLRANFRDEHFSLDDVLEEECCEEDTTTNKIEDIIYPLYVPADTYLTGKDTILLNKGERVILTFSGDKGFILVEETINIPRELEIIPVYGEPVFLNDTIAALSGNSLRWAKNNVEYYLTSNVLSPAELTVIAESLENATATASEK